VKIHLVVSQPFESYAKGQIITDQALVAKLRRGPHRHSVVRVIEKPEHASGDFFRSDAELADKRKLSCALAGQE